MLVSYEYNMNMKDLTEILVAVQSRLVAELAYSSRVHISLVVFKMLLHVLLLLYIWVICYIIISSIYQYNERRGELRDLRPPKAAGPDEAFPWGVGEPLQWAFNQALHLRRALWETSCIVPV